MDDKPGGNVAFRKAAVKTQAADFSAGGFLVPCLIASERDELITVSRSAHIGESPDKQIHLTV
jgi:hypothetical protein